MSKIIIDNKTNFPDLDAVRLVERVLEDGFLSTETIQGEKDVPKYCHATTFKTTVSSNKYGVEPIRFIVYARPRKTQQSAYSFLVYAEKVNK